MTLIFITVYIANQTRFDDKVDWLELKLVYPNEQRINYFFRGLNLFKVYSNLREL